MRRRILLVAASACLAMAAGVGGAIAVAATTTGPNPPPTTSNIFGNATPATPDSGPDSQASLGVKFHADRDGNILGIRFYKSAANTGTHVGTLFDANSTKLALATFTNETASGWQDVQFANPVAIKANTEYYAAYNTTVGHEAADPHYSWPVTTTPLTGDEGTYCYGDANCFPTSVFQNDNYYVDVDFQATGSPPPPSAAGIHVSGNQLLDANNQPVRLQGFQRAGTSYACQQGFGFTDGPSGDSEFQPMTTWDANTVYLGLNEDCWLGINGVPAAYSGQNYINFIKSEVASAEKQGLNPAIGFDVGDPDTDAPNFNDGSNGQPPMPDNDHTPLFWEEVATTFKNDPDVLFRLQNEPHPAGNGIGLNAWQCWSQGDVQYNPSSDQTPPTAPVPVSNNQNCSESDTAGTAYKTVGMQSLVNIIRGTGATNVIQVPGVSYANMYACSSTGGPTSCGFLDSTDGIRIHDTLSPEQLMGDTDNYPDIGQYCNTTSCYDATYAPVAQVMPIDGGEAGVIDPTQPFPGFQATMQWFKSHDASTYAAAWDTWSTMISDYNGTPKAPVGTWLYSFMTGTPLPSAPANTAPTTSTGTAQQVQR